MIAVVFTHVAAQNWYTMDIHSFEWNVHNFFDALSRFGVPIFVMISGALFLSREQQIEKLFKKNILKIVIIFFFWSLVYDFYQLFAQKTVATPGDFIVNLVRGPYHLWFLFMIVGLYIIVPFLRKIVVDKKLMKYFLILSLVFAFIVPKLVELLAIKFPQVADTLNYVIDSMKLNFVLGYSGYFVLGYALHTSKISKKSEYIIYILGVLGAIFTIVATMFLSRYQGTANALFYNNLTVNVLAMSVAVFVFFKQHLNKKMSSKMEKKITFLSECCLGMYLVHLLVMFILENVVHFSTANFNPVFSIPVVGIVVTVISFVVAVILKKIPFLNRWIV